VLVATRDEVLLWDPRGTGAPSRFVVAGTAYLHTGSTRFAVVHEGDTSVADLWDVASLTRVATLEGSFKGQALASFSADGNRFLFGACANVPNRLELDDCAIAVYTFPEGRLVHRTTLPRMALGMYMWVPQLSPSGTYFALSHETLPSRAYESATGKLAFAADGRREVYLDAQASRVDLGAADFTYEHALSPDRKRMAILVAHNKPERREIAVWSVDNNVASRQKVPLDVCPEYCEIVWLSARELVVRPLEGAAGSRLRLDVEAGQSATEPDIETPIFREGPFRVFGGFSVTKRGGRAELGPNPRGTTVDGGTLEIEGAARMPLPGLRSNDTALYVDGDRLVVVGEQAVDVVTKEGSMAELAR
jgi:hypothetical protein